MLPSLETVQPSPVHPARWSIAGRLRRRRRPSVLLRHWLRRLTEEHFLQPMIPCHRKSILFIPIVAHRQLHLIRQGVDDWPLSKSIRLRPRRREQRLGDVTALLESRRPRLGRICSWRELVVRVRVQPVPPRWLLPNAATPRFASLQRARCKGDRGGSGVGMESLLVDSH